MAHSLSRACYCLFVATPALALLLIGGAGCLPKTPSENEFFVTLDQAFEKVEQQDQIVVLGTLKNWNQDNDGNVVWAFVSPLKLQPKGEHSDRQKTSSDSIKSIVENIKFGNAQVPDIVGKSCEFTEWENSQGTWRMRTAETQEAYIISLEKI